MWAKQKQSAFTIVELLIVIVVIAILAAITIVAYNGIQDRARTTSLASALSQASKAVAVYKAQYETFPATLAAANITDKNSISYQYSYNTTTNSYCITGMYDGKIPYNITNATGVISGPCDGQSGGTTYCPTYYVAINGYYCDGTEGSTASLNSGAVKLAASASGVPASAPGAYVGRQSSRDNTMGNAFTVVAGEVYCVEEWAATASSAVSHAAGLQMNGSGMSTTWQDGGARVSPTTTWKKISGCITVPSGYTSATVWTQNDGTPGTTASVDWYQTAVKITKQ